LTRIFGGRIAAGIIPARAGFTAYNIAGNNIATDHPRSRGVYFTHFRTEPANEGSSPLARGLLWAWQCPSYRPGIIPARAGFTVFHDHEFCSVGDHPRSRGVYCWRAALHIMSERIIPARAGFTASKPRVVFVLRDHPRSRGVYHGRITFTLPRSGSSPLARGLLRQRPTQTIRTRIIPARAGFTSRNCGAPIRSEDHPRSRGVYPGGCDRRPLPLGSSPLARGLPIPATAGYTY